MKNFAYLRLYEIIYTKEYIIIIGKDVDRSFLIRIAQKIEEKSKSLIICFRSIQR